MLSDGGLQNGWSQQAAHRFKSLWLLKIVGITICITAFMVLYLTMQQHPQFPVTRIPPTALDRMFGFHAWSMVPYCSLWLYIGFPAQLLLHRREYVAYVSSVVALATIGCVIFLFWPTRIIQPAIDWAMYPPVAFLKSVDAAAGGNACPSMHVGFSVLTVLWLQRLLRRISAPLIVHLANVAWCVLIIWSTMALKQHLIVDVVAGALLALIIVVPAVSFINNQPVWSGASGNRVR